MDFHQNNRANQGGQNRNANPMMNNQTGRRMFVPVTGVITEIQDAQMGSGRNTGCSKMVTIEQEDGNIVNFIVLPSTAIIDCVTFYVTQQVVMFYDPMAPMPLIYPPQYRAVAAGENVPGVNVAAGFFDRTLLSADRMLRLTPDAQTVQVTSNNQRFTQNPGGRNLVAVYERSTRSIPAQTTPVKIIVMCGCSM